MQNVILISTQNGSAATQSNSVVNSNFDLQNVFQVLQHMMFWTSYKYFYLS